MNHALGEVMSGCLTAQAVSVAVRVGLFGDRTEGPDVHADSAARLERALAALGVDGSRVRELAPGGGTDTTVMAVAKHWAELGAITADLRVGDDAMLRAADRLGPWVGAAARAQLVHAFVELGVAASLRRGAATREGIAATVNASPRGVGALLARLSSLGLVDRDGPLYALAPASEVLAADGALAASARLLGHPAHWAAWGALEHAVRTGETAFDRANGRSFFAMLDADPALAACFHEIMTQPPEADAAVIAACRFENVRVCVDVGGGRGTLLARAGLVVPTLHGIIFDRPSAIEGRALDGAGRFELVAGDFFASIPEGADAYLLRHVLHDFDDSNAARILRRVAEAARGSAAARAHRGAGARLLVIEHLLDDSPSTALLDLQMLVLTGGRERSEAELREILASAGFRVLRVTAARPGPCVLEAEPR